jgi:hypothetical protein
MLALYFFQVPGPVGSNVRRTKLARNRAKQTDSEKAGK